MKKSKLKICTLFPPDFALLIKLPLRALIIEKSSSEQKVCERNKILEEESETQISNFYYQQ